MNKKLGIYVHIPFCERKCHYCGFTSFPLIDDKQLEEYVKLLCKEIEIRGGQYSSSHVVDTIFIGGGTPSLLSISQISKVIKALEHNFQIDSEAEITIEANPNSLTLEKITAYMDLSINRISMGGQSFDEKLLIQLGRVHSPDQIHKAAALLKSTNWPNWNLDLIFGLPNQTIDTWEDSLNQAISLNPDHLSLYSLQLEEGTRFYNEYKSGTLDLPEYNIDRQMFYMACETLKENGYDHYEISNFGKKKSRHNLKYWHMDDYQGIGLDSSSYINGLRFKNSHIMETWQFDVLDNMKSKDQRDMVPETVEEAMAIYCFTSLRLAEGLSLEDFSRRWNKDFFQEYSHIMDEIEQYQSEGLVKIDDKHITLTNEGIGKSNIVMSVFV